MREPTIVTDWCSLPPVTSYGGEEFSTRVLELQYRNLERDNEALKARVAELEKYKEFHSLVCTITATNFIKANAIREAANKLYQENDWVDRDKLIEHADKVERGES